MGVQVKNFGEKQLSEIRAQFAHLGDAISDVAKVAQLHQPLSDVLESLKAQVKGSWNLDAEKIDNQFKSLLAKVNGVGALVNSLTKKADESLQALDRLRPGALKAGIDEFAARMSASWGTRVEDKLVKNIKLLQGATQSRFQEQGIAIAELTSLRKSNTGLLREVRNALGEYSEEHRNNLAVVQATQAVVESMPVWRSSRPKCQRLCKSCGIWWRLRLNFCKDSARPFKDCLLLIAHRHWEAKAGQRRAAESPSTLTTLCADRGSRPSTTRQMPALRRGERVRPCNA